MGAPRITEDVARDLRERYGFDDEDLRLLGAKLADGPQAVRRAENRAFAERFVGEYREMFGRLAR